MVAVEREIQSRRGMNHQDAVMKRARRTLSARAHSGVVDRNRKGGKQQNRGDPPGVSHVGITYHADIDQAIRGFCSVRGSGVSASPYAQYVRSKLRY